MLRNFSKTARLGLKNLDIWLEKCGQGCELFVPLIFCLFALFWMPVRSNLSFDTDEGQELMKAVLYARGYTLYEDIWMDQPPLLTICLSAWFKIFGASIFAGRLLVLAFAALLIWSFFKTLQACGGNRLALLGTGLLALSGNFLRIGVSVMMGLPAASLTMLSIYLLVLYLKNPRLPSLLLSGAAFAVSLQFKMFSVFLLPIILFSLGLRHSPLRGKKYFLSTAVEAGLWLAAFAITFTLIGLNFNALHLDNVFNFHISKNLKKVFVNENSPVDIGLMLLQDFDLVLLAGLGTRTLLEKRDRWLLFPAIWLVTAILMLLNHKPVWYHHYLLLSIPLAWLAGYGVMATISGEKKWRKLGIALCLLGAIAIPLKLGAIQWQNRTFLAESRVKMEVVRRIVRYQSETHWLFTDNPIYAFQANLLVPPEIAVLSRKRVAAGEVTRDYLEALMAKYRPEQVVLERFPEVYESLKPNLEANYVKLEDSGARRHFILKNLSKHDLREKV